MQRFANRRRQAEADTELNLVPIMNMFMVLIPFLLMSASFYQVHAINTSVPVHSSDPASAGGEKAQKPAHKLTVVFELKEETVKLSALCDTLSADALAPFEATFSRAEADRLSGKSIAAYLRKLKTSYPASDTVLLIPADEVRYDAIIQAMDCARKNNEAVLFPNVVLSASLG